MQQTILLLRYKGLAGARWLGAHWFPLFLLGPLLLYGLFFIVEPSLMDAGAWLRERARGWRVGNLDPAALVLATALVAFSLPRVLREVYSIGNGDAALDGLAVKPTARLHASIAAEFLKSLPAMAVLWVLLRAVASQGASGELFAEQGLILVAAAVQLALLGIATALTLVHFRLFSPLRISLQAALLVACAVASAWDPLWRIPLLPLVVPATLLSDAAAISLPVAYPPSFRLSAWWFWIVSAAVLYALNWRMYAAWRDAGQEAAIALSSRQYSSGSRGKEWIESRLGPAAASQLRRDWKLTARVFSPAVYVACALAVLFPLAAAAAASRLELDSVWSGRAVGFGCCFGTLAICALGPLLLKHQLPYYWMESSCGLPIESIWRSKLWYTRSLGLAALAVSCAAALLSGRFGPAELAIVAFQCTMAAFTISSFVGVMVFEIAGDPVLGIALSGAVSLSLAGLFIVAPEYSLLWLAFLAYGFAKMGERAEDRLRFIEVEP